MKNKTEIIKLLSKETLINYINEFLKIIQSNQKLNKEDNLILKELNKELFTRL